MEVWKKKKKKNPNHTFVWNRFAVSYSVIRGFFFFFSYLHETKKKKNLFIP